MKNWNLILGNSMVSSAIWKKHARVSFSKTIKGLLRMKCHKFEVFEKQMSAYFPKIAR